MKLAAIFSDNMVLQRDEAVAVFGTISGKERIEITIDDIHIEREIGEGAPEDDSYRLSEPDISPKEQMFSRGAMEVPEGEKDFVVMLPPHKAGGPYTLTVKSESETYEFKNVMYGEVWLMNGQSNIEMEVQTCAGGRDEVKSFSSDKLRFYNVPKMPLVNDELLQQEEYTAWRICDKHDFLDMSAIGYYFGRHLEEEMDVTVGIVDCYVGGTSVTCWLSKDNIDKEPAAKHYVDEYIGIIESKSDEVYEKEIADYQAQVDLWCAGQDENGDNPNMDFPWPPPMGYKSNYRPAGIYYSMIKRVVPFTVKGIVYYQGEEDTYRTDDYESLLSRLITEYREDWRSSSLPVYIVQLPRFQGDGDDTVNWAILRAAQEKTTKDMSDAYLVCIIDCGEKDDIHPKDKKTPGVRIAKKALEDIYGMDTMSENMELSAVEKVADGVRLTFTNTYGSVKVDGQDVSGFEVSKDGENWHSIDGAEISGDSILIKCDADTAYIRYGFFNWGDVNVFNAAGTPLVPFAKTEIK